MGLWLTRGLRSDNFYVVILGCLFAEHSGTWRESTKPVELLKRRFHGRLFLQLNASLPFLFLLLLLFLRT